MKNPYLPILFNISSTETPYNFASASKFDVLGSDVPFSHFDTACLLTPRLSATNSCVILQRILCSLIISPKDCFISAFSFLTTEEFEYFFKHDIIFSEKFLDTASSGPEIPITLQDIIQIGSNGIAGIATGQISLKTLKLLLEGVTLGGKLKKHYLAFPETPKGYDEWVKEADAIWKQVGKMS